MEIRDAIHGLVKYNGLEEALINSQVLQRLRRIKQLALANLVYPSAGHSRFEHVVGVMHLAGTMADQLELSSDDRQTVRLGALLHDIGHPPFSHTSELVLKKFTDPATLEDQKRERNIETIHEAITVDILKFDPEIRKTISAFSSASMIEHVIALIEPNDRNLPKQIVSGPLDADKLDYIYRDAHQAGVSYGVFDLDKIIDSLTPLRESPTEQFIGVKEEGVWAIEQLLLAKYHMNAQVYRHKIRRITDAMLVRGLTLAVQEGIGDLRRLYSYEPTQEYCKFFLSYDDDTLMREVMTKSNGSAKEILGRLCRRHLLKEVFRQKVDTDSFPDVLKLRKLEKLGDPRVSQIENEIAKKIGVPPELVVFDKQSLINPTFKYPERKINAETIIVLMQDGSRRRFSDVSTVFANTVVGPRDEYLYVYAPLDGLSRDERNRKFSELHTTIYEIIDRQLA